MSSSPLACSHRCRMPCPCRLPLSSRPSHELDAKLAVTTRQALSRRAQRARLARSCHLTSSLETRKGFDASRRAPPLLLSFHLSISIFSTLVSTFSPPSSSSPTPLVCPSTCLPLSPRTCNGSEYYVRRGRRCGSAQAGRAEGISAAPPGSGTPPSSHIDEVSPRRAEQQGTVLHHQVAEHPLAPSST